MLAGVDSRPARAYNLALEINSDFGYEIAEFAFSGTLI
jgi:hypothetical protein